MTEARMARLDLGALFAGMGVVLAGCAGVTPKLGYPGQYPAAFSDGAVPRSRLGLRAVPEWERSRWLMVALPCQANPQESPEGWAARWRGVLEKATDAVQLVLVVNEDRLDELAELAELCEDHADDVEVLFAATGSPWLRDYGPIFARDRAGATYALDALRSDPRGATEGSWDEEVMPLRLTEFLGSRGANVRLLPIPVFLDGGDFAADGRGTAFTSREAVLRNGGDRANLERVFARCFGASRIVVFEPLPGPVARHIDMFFKLADERTALLGQYGPAETLPPPLNILQRQAQQAMERNALVLEREWVRAAPGRRVIRIPMPDLTIESTGGPERKRPEQPREGAAEEEQAPTSCVVYRTYLNALFIKGSKNLLIVPSYGTADRKAEEEIHATLARVYADCHGRTELVPFPSEPEIREGGSIHCVAVTAP